MTSFELLICACLVTGSAFLSASEIALFSLSRFQLRSLKERLRPAYRKIKRLLGDPGGLLITILVINEILNISISTLVAGAVARSWENSPESAIRALHLRFFASTPEWLFQMAAGILLTTPIVLLFCEITPKVVAARASEVVAPLSVSPLSWIYDGMKPVRIVLKRVVAWISKYLGKGKSTEFDHDHEAHRPLLREEEFLVMIEEGHKEGAIQETEMELIRNVFEFDDTRVLDICTPLNQVQSLSENTPVQAALAQMKTGQKFSRIPVTAVDRKKIVGVLYTKDLLLEKLQPSNHQAPISGYMLKPFIVSPDTKLNTLFRKFKQNKMHMAIVEDSHGGTIGVVTMSDVLDALFEEILE